MCDWINLNEGLYWMFDLFFWDFDLKIYYVFFGIFKNKYFVIYYVVNVVY